MGMKGKKFVANQVAQGCGMGQDAHIGEEKSSFI
jgi:hypothetical protein